MPLPADTIRAGEMRQYDLNYVATALLAVIGWLLTFAGPVMISKLPQAETILQIAHRTSLIRANISGIASFDMYPVQFHRLVLRVIAPLPYLLRRGAFSRLGLHSRALRPQPKALRVEWLSWWPTQPGRP